MTKLEAIRAGLIWTYLIGLPLWAVTDFRGPAGPAVAVPIDAPDPHAHAPPPPRRLPPQVVTDERWFQSAQRQLGKQGAEYIRLEKWTTEPAVYCFVCRPADAEPLSALSTSAQRAVEHVVDRLRDRQPLDADPRRDSAAKVLPPPSLNRR